MSWFPMFVDLGDQPVLLVGGGPVAAHKLKILVDFGAAVEVVAPELCPEVLELAEQFPENVQLSRRPFDASDITSDESFLTLVVSASDDPDLNAAVSELCQEHRIPVNVVDCPELCTFYFPAIVRDGDVVCGVSTGGKSPILAQQIRNRIRDEFPEEVGAVNDRMGELRSRVLKRVPDPNARKAALRELLNALLADPDVPEQKLEEILKSYE